MNRRRTVNRGVGQFNYALRKLFQLNLNKHFRIKSDSSEVSNTP